MHVLMAWLVSLRLASRRLDVSVHQCLDIWRNRPAIVVILDEQDRSRSALVGRINRMFPF